MMMPQGNSMLSPSTNPPMMMPQSPSMFGGNGTGMPQTPMFGGGMPNTMALPTETEIRNYMIQKYMAMPNYDQKTVNSAPDVSVRGGILSRLMNSDSTGSVK